MEPIPRSTATSYITSFFNKKKQIDTFERPQYTVAESSVENDLRLMSLGLARIFTYDELNKATDNFKEVLGRGGYGTVYIGKLRDERMVAVKEITERDQKQLEQFINEVNILSCLDHENLVALYGYTNTDKELLLVYELVPNGTLWDHLHGGQLTPLTLSVRIDIAIGTAKALSYLHSRDPQIVHRDVKPENILLNHAFKVKVADFGLCRLLPQDKQLSTVTQSTIGYQDPEYEHTLTLTDKSDVYSFGVVLAELISGKKAVDVDRACAGEEIYLHRMALNKMKKNKLSQLVDPQLGYQDDEHKKRIIKLVAKLAQQCLEPKRKNRPLMREVLEALEGIRNEPLFVGRSSTESGEGRNYQGHSKVTYGFSLTKGKTDHSMEDYHVAKFIQINGWEIGLFAIFDGHLGDSVPAYLQKHLFENILKEEEFWTHPDRAIIKAYEKTDKAILSHNPQLGRGGSSAVTAILLNLHTLWIANIGDSRAVLARDGLAIQTTVDHYPQMERGSIEERGGFVSNMPGDVPRVNGQLAVSRTFGDMVLKSFLSSNPDVYSTEIHSDTELLILASGGLWEVMSNQEAVDLARTIGNPQAAAKKLVSEARNRDSRDDISCIVLRFQA